MLKRKTGNTTSTIKKRLKLTESQKYIQKTLSPVPIHKPKEKNHSLYPQLYSTITSYLQDYKKRLNTKANNLSRNEKIFIVQGPAGSGKTHFVRQLGADLKLKLLELSTSVNRSKVNVIKILGEATQTFSIEKGENSGTIIFVDDVDVVLEPDTGFFKGIEFILMNNKCPVVLTCQVVPKFLTWLNVKVLRLDNKVMHGNKIVAKLMQRCRPGIGVVEMENILNKTERNLNAVSSGLRFKELSFVYGPEVRLVSEKSFKVLNPEGFFEGMWEKAHIDVNNFELINDFLGNLQEIDLIESSLRKFPVEGNYRVASYYQGVEKFYIQHRDRDEEFMLEDNEGKNDYKKIAREHLVQMGETEDYVGYLQVLKEFPVVLHPSYLLRHTEKKKATYFDIFLQKNPNLFNPSQ